MDGRLASIFTEALLGMENVILTLVRSVLSRDKRKDSCETMSTHRLLFVDDEENVLRALKRLFAEEGYHIMTSKSGEEALARLDGRRVSLVISDQRMPGMQGVELLSRIKQASPDTIGILLTGHSDIKAAIEAINSGAVYKYMMKPWDDEQCKVTVRRALEKYDIEQENKRLHRRIERQNKKLRRLNRNLERAKELLTISFQRYMSAHLLDRILKSAKPVSLSGEKRQVTILVSDIRGFTSLAENMTPEELVKFLNRYFEVMVDVILDNEGLLDKFMGDGIMALFGAIHSSSQDSLRCVRAALQMQQAVRKLNAEWSKNGHPQIEIGIGVSRGNVVVGNIGSHKRMEFTVIGQDVNYAQRIEGLTKVFPSGILVSEAVYLELKDCVEAAHYGPVHIKGKKDPIVVYGIEALRRD